MPQVAVPDGLFSDDSSFYGDEDEVAELKEREIDFEPMSYWAASQESALGSITASQRAAVKRQMSSNLSEGGGSLLDKKAASRHPYDGKPYCHQVTETIGDFLHRLPPSTTSESQLRSPWIFVANRKADRDFDSVDESSLRMKGSDLLEEFEELLSRLQAEHTKGQSRAGLTRKINAERRKLETELLKVARDTGVISGKWMLFPSVEHVDDVWAAVAGATVKGKLGIVAKVATNTSAPGGLLICVYTKDFADREDIRRVLVALIDMGLVSKGERGSRPIYYKCDAYTHLDVKSGNIWGLKASMYSSTDILARKW
jgi:hypothetical protein